MATTKNTRTTHQSNDGSFGLLANGSSGQWEIAIDETTSGAERWFAQIEGAAVSFYFEIPSLDIVDEMLRFLEPRFAAPKEPPSGSAKRNDPLVIGKGKKTPITLIKDDEYEGRFFLAVGPLDGPLARFVIAGADAVNIADALRQVKEDLASED